MQKKLFLALCVFLLLGALAVSCSFSIVKQQPAAATVTRVLDTETPVPPGVTPPVNAWSGSVDARISTPVSIFKDGLPNTVEAQDVIYAIERAYAVEAEAGSTLDLSKFPTVFINDPRFKVDPHTLKVVREMTHNSSLETAGYLDYKVAYYTWANNAILHAEAVEEKAKSENRNLTETESQSLIDEYGRMAPARAPTLAPGETRKRPALRFISVTINNDIAVVVLDDGPATFEMNLVLVDGKWYIAGIGKTISFHP